MAIAKSRAGLQIHPHVLVGVAAFLIKAIVLAQLHDHPLLVPAGDLDSGYYFRLAQRVASGDPLLGNEPFFVSPLYIYFLAATVPFDPGASALAARIAQIVLGAAAAGLVAATAALWFGRRAGLIAGAIYCATGLFTFYEVLILQAALDPFLTGLALYLLARALTTPERPRFLPAGLAFGLLALNRPNALSYGLFVCVALCVWAGLTASATASPPELRRTRRGPLLRGTPDRLRRRKGPPLQRTTRITGLRAAALFGIGLVLAIAPVAIRNYAVSREPILITSHGGLNFYIGNNPDADGTYTSVPGITPSITGQADDAERLVSAERGRSVTAREVSDYFYGRARDWIVEHPGRAAALFLRKLAYLLNATPLTLNYSYTYYSRDEPTLLRVLAVGPWMLIPLGLAGLLLPYWRDRFAIAIDEDRSRGYGIWAMFVPVYALSVAAFFVSSRYRLPLLVPLTMTSAAAVDWVIVSLRTGERRRLIVAAACLVPLFAIANWNFGLDDGRAEERTQMLMHLIDDGRREDALRRLPELEASHPEPGLMLYRVGRALHEVGRPADAVAVLQRAAAKAPRPEVALKLGQALFDAGRAADAVAELQRAVDAGAGGDVALFDLARAQAAVGQRERAAQTLRKVDLNNADAQSLGAIADLALELRDLGRAREALERSIAQDSTNAAVHLNLAVVYAEEGRFDEARAYAEAALRLRPGYEQARKLLEAIDH